MSTLGFDVFYRDHGAQQGFKKLGTTVDQTHAKFGKINAGLGQLGGLAKAGGVAAAAGLAIGAGAAIKYGLDVASANEQAKIGFTTMLGSAQKAEKFLVQLQRFAAKTPFEFPELQQAASKLIAVGVSAKNVIPIMKTIGNVTSGMGTGAEGVQRAVVALQQMSAAGRITAEDLNQLRDAGIPLNAVFKAIGDATGKSSQEIAVMARTGKLGRAELNALMDAMESGRGFEKFNGLMDKQSKSLAGMMSTLKDTFGQGMAGAMQAGLPFLKQGIGVATNALSRFFKWIQTHQEDTVSFIVGIGDGFFGIGEAVLQFATVSLRAIGKVSSSMAGFFESMSHLPFIGKGFRQAAEGLRSVGPAAEDAAADLENKLIPKIKSAHSAWDKFGKDQKAGAALRDSIMKVKIAHDAANRSIKENGKTLDSNTQKGRNNREALKNMASASKGLHDRLVQQHASTKKVNKADDDARASFIKTAMRMGKSREAAEKLANKYGLVDRKINDLNNKTVKTKVTFSVSGSGFKLHIPNSLSVVKAMAGGGPVRGPGTGTSDSILGVGSDGIPTARVSRGEFVVNAKSTRKYRPLIDDINADRLAGGGVVDPKLYSNRFPNPRYTGEALQNRTARGISRRVGDAIGKSSDAFIPVFAGLPGGGKATGHGMAALFRYASHLGMGHSTYPGHGERGMNKAWDFSPVGGGRGNRLAGHAWANARAYGIWYVIWNRHIASRTRPGAGWRPYTRYGANASPSQAHTNHVHVSWYDKGGLLKPGAIGANLSGQPERVLSPAQTKSFDRMVRVMDRNGGTSSVTYIINAPNYVGSRDELRQTLVDMNRRGQLEVIKR